MNDLALIIVGVVIVAVICIYIWMEHGGVSFPDTDEPDDEQK